MLGKIKKLRQLRTASSDTPPANTTTTNRSGRFVVGLDIGTEYVKALIAEVAGEQLRVLGVGRAHQSLSDMQSGAVADISGVVANCEKALTEAEDQAGISPRETIIGIAGELVKGLTTTVRYRRPNPEKSIVGEEIERIIDHAQAKTLEKAKRQLEIETGKKDVEVKLVNSAIVAMHIDTYKVSNPIGFQGKEIAIQLYTAFAPIVHIGALQKAAEELDLDLMSVAAEPFAVSRSVIGTDAASDFTAILIDIGGGTTDIAVVDDGGVQGTRMFGIGGRAFTKAIATDLDVDFEKAEKYKLALQSDDLSATKKAAVIKAIKKTLAVWIDGVELALGEFRGVEHLPHRIFLCGGGASLSLLQERLNARDWTVDLPFTRQPIAKLIDPSQTADIIDETGLVVDHTLITALGLLRVGYDTIQGESGGSRLKDRFNKILSI